MDPSAAEPTSSVAKAAASLPAPLVRPTNHEWHLWMIPRLPGWMESA